MYEEERSTAPPKPWQLGKLVWAKRSVRVTAKLRSQAQEAQGKNFPNGRSHFPNYSGVCQLPILNWVAILLRVSDSKWQSFLKDTLLLVDSWSGMRSAQTFIKSLPCCSLRFRVYLLTFGMRSFAIKLPVLSSEVSPQTSPTPERQSTSTTSISSSSPDRLGSNIATCTTLLSGYLTIGSSCHSWFKNPAYTCIAASHISLLPSKGGQKVGRREQQNTLTMFRSGLCLGRGTGTVLSFILESLF